MRKIFLMGLTVLACASMASAAVILEVRDSAGALTGNLVQGGVWSNSSANSTAEGCIAGGSLYASTYKGVVGLKEGTFTATLPQAGDYEVFVTWGVGSNRRANIKHVVTHASGSNAVLVDQTATANTWVSLGTYTFGTTGSVKITNEDLNLSGSMYADAVKFEYVPEPATLALLSLGGLLFRRRRMA